KPIHPKELYHAISHWCPDHVSGTNIDMVQTASSEMMDKLQIDGVDVEEGLSRTLGNRAFYLELLTRFCDDQRAAIHNMRVALDANEPVLAERLAHTLKGVSGLIGANTIRLLAGQLENGIHDRSERNELELAFAECDDQLQATIFAIEQVLLKEKSAAATDTAEPDGKPVDRDAMQSLLTRCQLLLSEYDGEALDLLLEAHLEIANALGGDVQKQILRAAKQFDFDAARDVLKQSAKTNGYDVID
ncbi:MAG: Hpt domain-containing protein, partial [Burkholderiales bacterium]|nr:Hpt domain-containing protein [Burkholderiales bacterium]